MFDITVDTREVNAKSNAALIPDLKDLGLSVDKQQLDVGDYILHDAEGEISLVTRKAGDLYTSIFDGHFADELNRCMKLIESLGGRGKLFWIQEGLWSTVYPNGGKGGDGLLQAFRSQMVSLDLSQRLLREGLFQRPTFPYDGRDNLPLNWNSTRDGADAGGDTREGTAGMAQQVNVILETTTITVVRRQPGTEVDVDMATLARSISDRIDSRILVGLRYLFAGDAPFRLQETPRRSGYWQERFIQLPGGS